MKKTLLLNVALFIFYSAGYGQIIDLTKDIDTGLPTNLNLNERGYISGDIDGDGDIDLIRNGNSLSLYKNDGKGFFTESEFPVSDQLKGSALLDQDEFHLIDLDGDGDLDMFFYTVKYETEYIVEDFTLISSERTYFYNTEIYSNDGKGAFTKNTDPGFFGPENAISTNFKVNGLQGFTDVDNDGDIDVIGFGDVFLNDGSTNFTPLGSTVFNNVIINSIKFLDAENDGDTDAIISGDDFIKLYLNDGTGNFSESLNSDDFVQAGKSAEIDIADTDNDGDLDILIQHTMSSYKSLYINNGNGKFSNLNSIDYLIKLVAANLFIDLDNDGDQDIVTIAGVGINDEGVVFENQGNNIFSPVKTIDGSYRSLSSIAADFNGDGYTDVLIGDRGDIYWNTPKSLSAPQDNLEKSTLKMFPNPSNGTIYFNLDKEYPSDIEIYSVTGKLVYKANQTKGITELTLNLPNGMYMAVVNSKNNSETFKLIIKK